ncbi:MAG: glycosyltransferase [Deltaproteobacteria bacterium]|nr:glycosyltransferase [Deltaproteobacteria bacterium]
MPLVSVIINCLNGERYLREAIDSVFAQTFQDWEIIFWDNASTDSSADIAQGYGDRVRYFKSETTSSLGRARNLAISRARGEYVALLDCDDLWLPQKLEKQLLLLRKNPDVALCYSNSMFFNSRGDLYDHFSQVKPKRGMVFQYLLESNFISSETMVFRKALLETLDYIFNEELTMVMDYDLTLRLAYRYPFDYVEEALSKWRMHEGSESNKKRFLIPRENKLMLEKLIHAHPGIATNYSDSVSLLENNANYQLGKSGIRGRPVKRGASSRRAA